MIGMLKVAAAVLALCAVVAGQDLPPNQLRQGSGGQESGSHETKDTKHLTATASATPAAVAPGKKVTLAIDVTPKPKMHVYSPGQEGYIAIALTLDANPAFTTAKAKYPAGEKLYMPLLKETQLVYAKPFRIVQDLTLASTPALRQQAAEGTPLTIKGMLRYQACDDTLCYLPATIPLAWTVALAK